MDAKELVKYACEALLERKGHDLEVLHIEQLTTLTEYFVICSATSTTQVKALADSVEFHLKNDYGVMPHHVEGFESSSCWCIFSCPRPAIFIAWKTCGRTARKSRCPSWALKNKI